MSMLNVQKPNLSPTSHLSSMSPTMRKRQWTLDQVGNATPAEGHAIPLLGPAVDDDTFITDHDAVESGGDENDDDKKPKDKKAGRWKIKIEYIQINRDIIQPPPSSTCPPPLQSLPPPLVTTTPPPHTNTTWQNGLKRSLPLLLQVPEGYFSLFIWFHSVTT